MRRLKENVDWGLVLVTVLIALLGIVNLRSASLVADSTAYITQIVWVILGGVFAILVAAIDYRHYERYSHIIYGICVLMLVLVLIIGREVKGSSRWLGFWELGVQPSELTKIAMILVTARFFAGARRPEGYSLKDLAPAIGTLMVPAVLILLEPDLGSTLVVVFIFASLLFFERLQRRTWLVLSAATLVSIPLMWYFGLHDYQKERILSFLDPDRYKLGSGWHARQSVIAVGSGQFTGKGYLHSTQTWGRFLPETRTDFVLATYAEEHGFLGILVLLALYFFLIAWALRIASTARDRFGALVAVGVAALIFWQVLFNVGMVVGMLPVVGITLPLMSYGGSSLLTVLIGIGLLLSVSAHRHVY